ncbi:MAG TPA: hypothetical protein VK453_20185 [Micromonosporaceae bacterium]|nr:hypothetical protein [Micromonosporaceae bacterium]
MDDDFANPDEAGEIRGRWREDPDSVRERLISRLAELDIDTDRLSWLSLQESRSVTQRWIDLGAQRYGGLALHPPPGSDARHAEYADGVPLSWLATTPREVFLLFFRPSPGGLLARSDFGFAIANLPALAHADGDGFGALTRDLEGVLLVNLDERPGKSALEIDAWGEFVRDDRG